MKYEMETMREIWPDKGSGEHLEIGPDRDGLGLVEIRQRDQDNKISDRIIVTRDAALLLAEALNLCATEIKTAGNDELCKS